MGLRHFPRLCGGIAFAFGLMVLFGWASGIDILTSLLPREPAAHPLTAVAMCFGGAAVGLLTVARGGARLTAAALAAAIVVVSLMTFLTYLGFDLGLERRIFFGRLEDRPGAYASPGRMAEVTALGFLLVGLGTAAKAFGRMVEAAVAFATVTLVLAGVKLLAYTFNTDALYEVIGFSDAALPTAVVLAALSVGLLAAEPLVGWPRRLTLDTPGGNASRFLLPLGTAAPIAVSFTAWLAGHQGFVPADFRLAAVTATTAAILGGVVMWAAARIDVQNSAREQERGKTIEARAGEARLRAVADAIPGLVFETDAEGRNTYVNDQYRTYTGLAAGELLGDGWQRVFHPDDRARAASGVREALRSAQPFQMECRIGRADGAWRWFMLRISVLRDRDGRVEKGIGVCTDVTEQREAIELQRTLLQEVSHRVKNSLALVSSLLRLQARTLDGTSRGALEEASQRVHAVARVHDQLWRGAGAREIDLKPFLADLCSAVGSTAPRHHTVCSAEPAVVSADLAAPLGLFVNELLANAYKHAYPEGQEGEVRVSGAKVPGGRYRLEVADAGGGLPAGFDLADSRESLGMRVITSLAAQLRGELVAEPATPGARFILLFPLTPD